MSGAVVHTGIGKQHTRAPRTRHDDDIFTFGRRQNLQATGKFQHIVEAVGTNHAALSQHCIVDLVIPARAPCVNGRPERPWPCVQL